MNERKIAMKRNWMTYAAVGVLCVLIAGCAKTQLQLYQDAIKKNPKSVAAHNNLAYYYRNNGNFKESLAEYDLSLKLRPNDFVANMNKGEVLFSMKRYQEALALFMSLIKANPNNSVLHNNIAMCFHQMGAFDRALAEYNEAIRLNPKNEPALKGLGYLKADMKMADKRTKGKAAPAPKAKGSEKKPK